MDQIEILAERIKKLEKRNKQLLLATATVAGFATFAMLGGAIPMQRAVAEGGEASVTLPRSAKFDTIEVRTIVVRDEDDEVRGMWTSNVDGPSTLAIAFKGAKPSVVLSADQTKAGVTIEDAGENHISLGVAPGQSALSMNGSKGKDSLFIGLTPGEGLLSVRSQMSAAIDLQASNSSMTLAENGGKMAFVDVTKEHTAMSFVDETDVKEYSVISEGGYSEISLNSSAIDSSTVISPSKDGEVIEEKKSNNKKTKKVDVKKEVKPENKKDVKKVFDKDKEKVEEKDEILKEEEVTSEVNNMETEKEETVEIDVKDEQPSSENVTSKIEE